MPFTAGDGHADRQFSQPIGIVPIRDALSRYQHGSVLMVPEDSDDVTLMPLRRAIDEHPGGSVIIFGKKPAAES